MHPLLNIAVPARRAGDVIMRSLSGLEGIEVTAKSRNDFVTEVDSTAEQEIISFIRKHYPAHGILAEESGQSGDDQHLWIIDPLDGTTNFLHGFPQFSVSIGFQLRGRMEVAVVYDPMRGELFTAVRREDYQNTEWWKEKQNQVNAATSVDEVWPFLKSPN